ncbi:hypothetical protein CVT24_002200, partial [Panaeolus cyanescens]
NVDLLDSYPFGLYSSIILNNVTGGSEDLKVIFGWNVVINLFYIPGTMIGAFVVDHLGPRWTMITGLLFQALVGFLMSGLYAKLTQHIAAFAVVYGIFLSFGEFGPGNNIGLLASKTCPTAIRGQFYGIAAAIGKVGAFVGTWAFPPMIEGKCCVYERNTRIKHGFWIASSLQPSVVIKLTEATLVHSGLEVVRLIICRQDGQKLTLYLVGLAILSALITYSLKPFDNDGMALEDQKFREYLEANGYDTSAMGLRGYDSEAGSVDEKGSA